jgi:hypothetical protein
LEYLANVKRVGTLVSDNGERNTESLGLDQAVYSYGAGGKFSAGAFLAALRFASELESEGRLRVFTRYRRDFEEFLVQHKFFINQIGHTKGSRTRPVESLLEMHRIVLSSLENGERDERRIVRKLKRNPKLRELKDVTNLPRDDTKRKRFSKAVQDAAVIRSVLDNRERCKECGARLPPSCRSKDHIEPVSEHGRGTLKNLQYTHPYCNSIKQQSRKAKKK